MNSSADQGPDAAHRPGFWKRLLATPLRDLLRGRVSGHGDWRILLGDSELPPDVRRSLEAVVVGLPRRRRSREGRSLIEWSRQQFAAGGTSEEVIAKVGDPGRLAELVRGGVSLSTVLGSPLAPEVRNAAHRFALRSGWFGSRRRKVMAGLEEHCRVRLDGGESVESLAAEIGESVALPDLVRRTNAAGPLFDARLPPEIWEVVREVIRRARLWKSENADVAQELIAHFEDGLAGGKSPEGLVESFGSTQVVARLIRRSRLRCRPLSWRVWRRTRQAVGVCAAVLIVVWCGLIVRFRSATPDITFDPVADLDAAAAAIAPDERAWPLYREGLLRLDYEDLSIWEDELPLALREGPVHLDWPTAETYLTEHQDSVDLFLEAAERSRFGYMHRDPSNESWIAWSGGEFARYGDFARNNEPGTYAHNILLPQVLELRRVTLFFTGHMWMAAEREDADEVIRTLKASLRLAEHVQEDGFVISQAVAMYCVRTVSETFSQIVVAHRGLFDSMQIQDLRGLLMSALGGDWELNHEATARLFVDDFLQHAYTDDGRFTPEGLRYLLDETYSAALPDSWVVYVLAGVQREESHSLPDRLTFDLLGSESAAWIASRTEMEEKIDELLTLYLAEVEQQNWSADDSALEQELGRIRSSWTMRRRYWPVLALFRRVGFNGFAARMLQLGATRLRLGRDAALVLLAVEEHRQEHGRLPAALEDFVPDYFDALPADPMSDGPLRYSLVDGVVHLYSLGPDGDDDGGTRLSRQESGDPGADGDWVLLPVQFD